ncbi:Hypothetical predicted protein [Mytilus galloprovincialis]|uniref:Uncharacterized protein n=1 Tax=Mytilus galloprovincialis TaxID=29158 RepID=A0A8B6CC53_MYTGA|nr:Hypothetical predicted protein [Mytilus galloprovincialis]
MGGIMSKFINRHTATHKPLNTEQHHLPLTANIQCEIEINHTDKLITDCAIIKDKLYFIWLDTPKIVIHNTDGTFDKEMNLSCKPLKISPIDCDTVAVLCDDGTIKLFTLPESIEQTSINTSKNCSGLSYKDGLLYVVVNGESIDVFSLDGIIIRTFCCPSSSIENIAVTNDQIFLTDWFHEGLYCCDLYGRIIWTCFNNDQILRQGLTTDDDGNIYVAGLYSRNVFVISSNGNSQTKLLTSSNGLDLPAAIHFDKILKYLLVCNADNGHAFLFQIKHRERDLEYLTMIDIVADKML